MQISAMRALSVLKKKKNCFQNKITAIVGTSGSGKTTLMKLLLKFYEPNKGQITIGKTDLNNIKQKSWRSHIGTVMQEGYIFNDTIANNIAVGVDVIDKERLVYATDVANILSFIQEYPLGFNTKIGQIDKKSIHQNDPKRTGRKRRESGST